MNQYIALLKGINVGGKNIIKMQALQLALIADGFLNVQTYIQSGNIVFEFKKTNTQILSDKISKCIATNFGLTIACIVISAAAFKTIIDQNPLKILTECNPEFIYLTFLENEINTESLSLLEQINSNKEKIALTCNVIYLYCPGGYSRSKYTNKTIETKLKVIATTRNWKTYLAILGML